MRNETVKRWWHSDEGEPCLTAVQSSHDTPRHSLSECSAYLLRHVLIQALWVGSRWIGPDKGRDVVDLYSILRYCDDQPRSLTTCRIGVLTSHVIGSSEQPAEVRTEVQHPSRSCSNRASLGTAPLHESYITPFLRIYLHFLPRASIIVPNSRYGRNSSA